MALSERIWAFHHAAPYPPPQCVMKLHPYGHKLCQLASAVWFHEAFLFTMNRIAVKSPHRSPGQVGLVKQCWVVGTAFGGLDLNLDFATYQYVTFSKLLSFSLLMPKLGW